MINKNICRFIQSPISDRLETHSFVYETDMETMHRRVRLAYNYAILITDGEGTIFFDTASFPFTKGQLIFGFSGEEMLVCPGQVCEYCYISFDGLRASSLFSRFDITYRNRLFGGFDGLISFWRESIARADDNTVDIAAEGVLLCTFSRFSRGIAERDDAVSRAKDYLERNFSDSRLSLSTVAAALGYNEKYLSHLFKSGMGIGVTEYIRTLRINHAAFLFDHGVESVKNVAVLSGFCDPLYFSSVFKKETGRSPKEYKTQRQKDNKPN